MVGCSLPVHIKVWTMLSHSNNKQYQDVITTSATIRQKCVTQLKQRGTTERYSLNKSVTQCKQCVQ